MMPTKYGKLIFIFTVILKIKIIHAMHRSECMHLLATFMFYKFNNICNKLVKPQAAGSDFYKRSSYICVDAFNVQKYICLYTRATNKV